MNALLHLEVESVHGHSRLRDAFVNTPFKLAVLPALHDAGELVLMVMNASPGILDGDQYTFRIQLHQGARLRLQTQAYQRIYEMKQGARQHWQVQLDEGASWVYLPHPTVPHTRSAFSSTAEFRLCTHHHFVYGEVLTCGRKHNGEVFSFTRYHSQTRIFLNGRLILHENLLMEPGRLPVQTPGQLEGYSHQASLIILNPLLNSQALRTRLLECFQQEQGIVAGISAAPVNGLVIRLLGYGAEQLHACLRQAETLSRAYLPDAREQQATPEPPVIPHA